MRWKGWTILPVLVACGEAYSAQDIPDAAEHAVDGGAESGSGADASAGNDAQPSCSEGQTYDGHCYFLVPQAEHAGAKLMCSGAGAHLVTLTTPGEQAFFVNYATTASDAGLIWIGLEADAGGAGRSDYHWVTGEPKTLEDWNDGQPNAGTPCVAYDRTIPGWNDRECNDLSPAMCERE